MKFPSGRRPSGRDSGQLRSEPLRYSSAPFPDEPIRKNRHENTSRWHGVIDGGRAAGGPYPLRLVSCRTGAFRPAVSGAPGGAFLTPVVRRPRLYRRGRVRGRGRRCRSRRSSTADDLRWRGRAADADAGSLRRHRVGLADGDGDRQRRAPPAGRACTPRERVGAVREDRPVDP